MKRLLWIVSLLNLGIAGSFACCAEEDYRLFPVGEQNGQPLMIEFDLYRNCDMGEDPENLEFFTRGTVRLVKIVGDSLAQVRFIDKISLKECACDYKTYYQKTQYEVALNKSYQKALRLAQTVRGFRWVHSMDITFNDSLNAQVEIIDNDTAYHHFISYKGIFQKDLTTEEIISCAPDKVAEVRSYETDLHVITILRLRCHYLEDEAIWRNRKRFVNMKTAFWKEQAQWHGIAKDYWVVEEKAGK